MVTDGVMAGATLIPLGTHRPQGSEMRTTRKPPYHGQQSKKPHHPHCGMIHPDSPEHGADG